LLVFFAAVAGVNAVLIRAALSTFAGVETKNPYEAGLSFGREIASAQAQEARHWKVAAIVRAAEDSPTVIEISADDAAGRRLTGLTALALLVHPEDKRLDRALDLTEHSPGAWRARTGPAAGQWDLVIDLSRDGSRLFRSKNRIVLP
jgi:nitrogen fixation protein FixH